MTEAKKEVPAPKAPANTLTFSVEHRSEVDGKMYSGDFTIRRLTLGLISKIGVETARMNGGLEVDTATDTINSMLATLRHAIVSAPEWWKPEDFYDGSLLSLVYNKQVEFENSFRRPTKEQA